MVSLGLVIVKKVFMTFDSAPQVFTVVVMCGHSSVCDLWS